MSRTRLVAFAAPWLCIPAPGWADVINVPADYATIQEGVDAAVDGDEIMVAPGAYLGSVNFLGKAIALGSSQGSAVTILLSPVSCVSGETADTLFEGFTVATELNRGMDIVFSSPNVQNCRFVNNYGIFGGGMYCSNGTPIITNCEFANNSAGARGGGIYCVGAGQPMLVDCTFDGNSADDEGGGLNNSSGGSPSVIGCTFYQNTAQRGGAMWLSSSGGAMVLNSRFLDNSASGTGGGIHAAFSLGDRAIANCLFVGNYAGSVGGGVLGRENLTLTNCTFYGNTASNDGGGLSAGGLTSLPAANNCVFWFNTPSPIYVDPKLKLSVSFSDVQGGWLGRGVGNIDADPLFMDPMAGDFRLLPGSPCIDAGDNAAVPEGVVTDLAGSARFVDDPDTKDAGLGEPPVVDMGAYEFQGAPGCPGDLTFDGVVGPLDLAILLGAWGPNAGHPADLFENGVVGPEDLAILLGVWGPCPE